ncbi:hypothetical protein CUAC110533_12050 [Cutibacterium acnes subsp. elongatum]|jgi:hypothetical protein
MPASNDKEEVIRDDKSPCPHLQSHTLRAGQDDGNLSQLTPVNHGFVIVLSRRSS